MKFYFAPLEGVAGHLYRSAHNTYFRDEVDTYFAPFIVADQHAGFKTRDRADILPENNVGLTLVPQILTNNAQDYIHTSRKIQQFGYTEINLNLGCPSGTVVSKKRGSGFLAFKEELNGFLEEIFTRPVTEISVKTRLGKEDPEEIHQLMQIYNQYPIKELIIHPRTQKDLYKNTPNWEMFRAALDSSRNPVCYNGDICTVADYMNLTDAFPDVETVMIGRGLLMYPGLIGLIKSGKRMDKETLKAFHDRIFEEYRRVIPGDRNVLFKMIELWRYMNHSFTNPEKYAKKIKKSLRLHDYEEAVERLFHEQELVV